MKHFDVMRGGMLEIIFGAELGKNFGNVINDLLRRSIK
jgi:hypothetical protein